ncbi:MAG: uroporphyrinogen decarboxylase family protein [Candidatus Bathyarchaeia archaeon]
MSPRERFIRAVCHEEPDRVPIFESLGVESPTADLVLGRASILGSAERRLTLELEGRYDELREGVVRDAFDLTVRLRFDAANIVLPPYLNPPPPQSRPQLVGEGLYKLGETVHRFIPESGVDLEIDSRIKREGIPAFEEHVRGLEEASGDEDSREVHEAFEEYDRRLGRAYRSLEIPTCSAAGHIPIGSSWFSQFLTWFYVRPDLVRRFFKAETRRNLRWIKLAIDYGAEFMILHGDIACTQGPFISPRQYHEFLLPEIREEVGFLHRRGVFAFNTSDGNLWPIIDDYLINSGVDGMMEIQKTAGMDSHRLKERFGDQICFNGGVDCSLILPFGSKEDTARETREAIETLSPGGGHILGSSHDIHQGVKPENFLTMMETARRHGAYTKH